MKKTKIDICVIGNGPAASTVSLMLAHYGLSTIMIGLPYYNNIPFGETLNPDLKTYLTHLGIWGDFLNDEHLQSPGNRSSWGGKIVMESNFIYHPNMYGWHINRQKFNDMFTNAAKRKGVRYLNSRVDTIKKNSDGTFAIKLTNLNNSKMDFISSFIVDATGRAGWFSSRQGIRRRAFDRLCGYVCFANSEIKTDCDPMTLIESTPNGWWYTALLPGNIRVTSFFTNFNLPFAKSLKKIDIWRNLIQKTEHVKPIIDKYKHSIISGPYTIISNSTRLEKVIGERWIAIGDSAATFDPLSSNGISKAIRDGIESSKLIKQYLEGDGLALEPYNEKFILGYNSYLNKRILYYRLEKRWRNSPFWIQNQQHIAMCIE